LRRCRSTPDSLGETTAGWPILGPICGSQTLRADRSILQAIPIPRGCTMRAARSSILKASTETDRLAIHSSTSATIQQSSSLGWTEQTCNETQRASRFIGDPRNDSHMLVSQLHLAMLKAHNAFVDEARLTGIVNGRVFDEAARQLRWHYQWLILNEFLPTLVGRTPCRSGASRRPALVSPWAQWIYTAREFADAAYRYGHSQNPPPLPIELRRPIPVPPFS